MKYDSCPFCSGDDHFKAALAEPISGRGFIAVHPKKKNMYRHPEETRQNLLFQRLIVHPGHAVLVEALLRGKYWIATTDDRYFVDRLRGFKGQYLALEREPEDDEPAGPMFHIEHLDSVQCRYDPPACTWRYFNASRLTHTDSSIEIYFHKWFTHDIIISIHGFPFEPASKADIKMWKDAQAYFFPLSMPGRPEEITKQRLTDAFNKLYRRGGSPNTRQLADELSCDYDAVRQAVKRHHIPVKRQRHKDPD